MGVNMMLEMAEMERNLPDLPLLAKQQAIQAMGNGETGMQSSRGELELEHNAALTHLDMHATKWWFGTHNTHIVSDEDIEEQKEQIDFFIGYVDHLSLTLGMEQGIMDWDTIIHFMENKYIF